MIMIFGALEQNDEISSCFFHFFKILIFQVARGWGGKRAKIVQNDKKLRLSCSTSQEPYIV